MVYVYLKSWGEFVVFVCLFAFGFVLLFGVSRLVVLCFALRLVLDYSCDILVVFC